MKNRALWIVEIKQRASFNQFKEYASDLIAAGENVTCVLKGSPRKYVYQVLVETMENCDNYPFETMWVTDQMAQATGWMLQEFERSISHEETFDDTPDADIEEAYRILCEQNIEKDGDSDDDDDDEDEFLESVDDDY